jgi:uncharacterized membrane protein YgdD (TMEM256/DUF423 family)
MNTLFRLGCFFAALGVAAGAFGAHGLKSILAPDMLAVYETAVRYQMYHSFGLIIVGTLAKKENTTARARLAGWCFIVGIFLFSGSLYALTLTDIRWFGAITPLGGIAFIAGWLFLAFSFIADQSPDRSL